MRKLVFAVLILAAVSAPTRNEGATASPRRKVVSWTFDRSNLNDATSRKTDLEGRFGIELEIINVPVNGYVRKLQSAMMDGQDVPNVLTWIIENDQVISSDAEKSLVLPLDAYVASSKLFKSVLPGRLSWLTYGGHVYGLPGEAHPVVLVYNDTLWKAAGVDLAKIETWDEFFEASRKLARDKKDGKPIHYALPYGNDGLANTGFLIWQQTGARILDADGAPRFTSPEFKAFLRKWLAWQETGAFTMWDWGNFKALLANGTYASYVSPDWWISQVNIAATGADDLTAALSDKSGKLPKPVWQFRVRALPAYAKGGPTAASWGGSFMAIPKGTKDPELIYRLIERVLYDPEAMMKRWQAGTLPASDSTWSDPAFHQPDPRFGGQKLGKLLMTAARGLPRVETGDLFWYAINAFNEAYPEIASGAIPVGGPHPRDSAVAAAAWGSRRSPDPRWTARRGSRARWRHPA